MPTQPTVLEACPADMLSWVESWFKKGAGFLTSNASRWIHVALHAIAGVVHTVFGDVTSAWDEFTHALWTIGVVLHYLSKIVFEALHWIILTGIPYVWHRLLKAEKVLGDWIRWAWHYVWTEANRLYRLGLHYTDDAINWFHNHIVTPIVTSLHNAWDWISKRGETLWFYITHPDKLADLIVGEIAGAIARSSDKVLSASGKILTALVLHNTTRMLHIVEDIITAVF